MSHDLNVLAKEIKDNNESAFKVFYDLLFPRLFRVAHYYLRHKENAEEVVMDVFIKIWKNRMKLPQIINLDNYTYTMLKNHSLNFLKKNKIKIDVLDDCHTSIMIEYLEPEKLFIGKELVKELEKAISRECLLMRCWFTIIIHVILSLRQLISKKSWDGKMGTSN